MLVEDEDPEPQVVEEVDDPEEDQVPVHLNEPSPPQDQPDITQILNEVMNRVDHDIKIQENEEAKAKQQEEETYVFDHRVLM